MLSGDQSMLSGDQSSPVSIRLGMGSEEFENACALLCHWFSSATMTGRRLLRSSAFINEISTYVGHEAVTHVPVTTMTEHCAVTFRHGTHQTWSVGDTVEVGLVVQLKV
jgi:hypothetical protein